MTQLKSTKENDLLPQFVTDFFNSDRFFGPGRWFEKELEEFMPAVNIKEAKNAFKIEMAAPGFEKADFKIQLEGDYLNIKAEKKTNVEEKDEKYTRKEYTFNAFNRSFTLPQNAAGENISASYENGILKLEVPKKQIENQKERKQIDIS